MSQWEAVYAKRGQVLWALALFGAAHFLLSVWGMTWAADPNGASMVWPAGGLALAAAFWLGLPTVAVVAISSLAATLVAGTATGSALALAAGNAGGAWLGWVLLRGKALVWFRIDPRLSCTGDVLRLAASGLISATISGLVVALVLLQPADPLAMLHHWIMGHALASMAITPFLLVGPSLPPPRNARQWILLGAAVAIPTLAVLSVYWRDLIEAPRYLLTACMVFAALSSGSRGVSAALMPVFFISVLMTGPGRAATHELPTLAYYLYFLATMSLVLSAVVAQRDQSQSLARAAEAVRESEERLKMALEAGQLGFWDWDKTTDHRVYGGHYASMLGYEDGEIGHHVESWYKLIHPDDLPAAEAALDAHLSGAAPFYETQYRLRHRDGTYRWILDRGRIVARDADGRPLRAVGTHADITARVIAEEGIRRLTEELEELVLERTGDLEGFAYSIAHDMRQHIRGINVNAKLIQMESSPYLPPDMQDNLSRMVAAAKRMDALTDDLLLHCRVGMQRVQMEAIDLTKMAASIGAKILEKPYANRDTRIEVQSSMSIHGDPTMISLALAHLIDNACKYSACRTIPMVQVGCENGVFFVRDNGVGFEGRYADRIFRPFERLDTRFEGTGIGLASVRRIVERHGGKAWAESIPGEGTTVYFSLGERSGAFGCSAVA